MPFKSLAEDYRAIVEARLRRPGDDRTRLSHWRTAFGEQDANTITARQIQRVLADLQAKRQQFDGVESRVQYRGKRLGLLRENPAVLAQTPKPNNILVRSFTESQERHLLASLPARFHPIVQRHFTPVSDKVNWCISDGRISIGPWACSRFTKRKWESGDVCR